MTPSLHRSPSLLRAALWTAMSWSALAAPLGAMPLSGPLSGPSSGPSSVISPEAPATQKHVHRFVRSTKRVWVKPQYKWVVIGKDKKGNPIREKKLIRPGYYKRVPVKRCSCGKEG